MPVNFRPNVISNTFSELGMSVVQGQQKKSGNLSCISFGEEYSYCSFLIQYSTAAIVK